MVASQPYSVIADYPNLFGRTWAFSLRDLGLLGELYFDHFSKKRIRKKVFISPTILNAGKNKLKGFSQVPIFFFKNSLG